MAPKLALLVCTGFMAWLFMRDRKLRPMTSAALWIPLSWFLIIGSKPVSTWLGTSIQFDRPEDYIEGSPLDRNVFLVLLLAAAGVLLRRRLHWRDVYQSNRFLFWFFLYCCISALWASYPFVAFKRWIKDFGNLAMILLMLSESDPVQAIRAVFSRYAYFAVTVSVLLIKYFPDMGRYYNPWTWEPGYAGVTTSKNELGGILFISGIFLIWDFLDLRGKFESRGDNRSDLISRVILGLMLFWLLAMAGSSTSAVCLLIGIAIVVWMRRPGATAKVRHLGTYSVIIGLLMLIVYSVPGIESAVLSVLGRDPTLTGRTELWTALMGAPINPVLGAGYLNFWIGPEAESLWAKFSFHPTQAHNGYLETYLNGGLLGLALLIILIVATARNLKRSFITPANIDVIRLSFFVVTLFYNWTEAMFNRLSLVWIIFLISALKLDRSDSEVSSREEFSLKAGW